MSKTSNIEEEELMQFEHSAEIALDFINDEILILLDNFEHNNEDKNYLYGVATMGLFNELIMRLGDMGYTEKELKKEVKTWLNTSLGQTLH
jgi:hypothetical protein